MNDVSYCIAMSEDGYSWFAFPKWMKRGQVMAGLAESSEIISGGWHWFLTNYRIRAGHVCPDVSRGEPGWWNECDDQCSASVPCWIVRRSC